MQYTGDNGQFKCQLCDLLLVKEDDLRNHLKNVHLLKKEIFSCNKCKRVFKSSRTLRTHETSCDTECVDEQGEEEDEGDDCDTSTVKPESQKKSVLGVTPCFH